MDEAKLKNYIKRISQGDKIAFKRFYDEYRKPIFLSALSITKDYHLAEDVMQDTFISIMNYSIELKNIDYPKRWIFTLVKNQSIKAIKKAHQNEMENIDDFSEVLITYDNIEHIDNPIEDIEALQCLEPVELQIVTLYIYGGLKQTEIAEVMNLSYLKVRSKYSYAIKKIKNFYERRNKSND